MDKDHRKVHQLVLLIQQKLGWENKWYVLPANCTHCAKCFLAMAMNVPHPQLCIYIDRKASHNHAWSAWSPDRC